MTKSFVPSLMVYVSGHGYGHWSQVVPVLNFMRELHPELTLTICSKVPLAHLRARLDGEFTHIPVATDFGMMMASALDVLVEDSMRNYQQMHANWDACVAEELARIRAVNPALVLSNVAYLPLVAARLAGVPAVAMCSLNWADIFRHYCGHLAGAGAIHSQMLAAYHDAQAFLRLAPGMPMPDFRHLQSIGPIGRLGRNRRAEINSALGLVVKDRLVLVSMGGIALRLPMEQWSGIPGVRWLVEAAWQVEHPDAVSLESLNMDFVDVLASCDALLCKPGYGSFAEAACNGIRVLYVSREDWPEEPWLVSWLEQHGSARRIERCALESGGFASGLLGLLAQPKPVPVEAEGIRQAGDYLLSMLAEAGFSQSASHHHN
jgi:hypothetical protein